MHILSKNEIWIKACQPSGHKRQVSLTIKSLAPGEYFHLDSGTVTGSEVFTAFVKLNMY